MSQETLPEFGVSKNIRQVSKTDLPGGGQVTVENGYAYVGHMGPSYGTSIVDVHDPKHPRLISQLEVPEGVHSHKVRVSGDVMLVNYERYKSTEKTPAGLKIFDISQREKPREIAFFKTEGVHRFTFDGRPHRGRRVRPVEIYGALEKALDDETRYSPGNACTVHVDPDDPEASVLDPSAGVVPWALGGVGVAGAAAAVLFLLKGLKA